MQSRLLLIADYKGDAITLENAARAVEQAETFFAAVRSKFFADKNSSLPLVSNLKLHVLFQNQRNIK